MLQRVYGTAFFDKKDLDAYLAQVEEAKKRDHRKLGKELGLFTISPLVGSGLILWMPKGATVRGLLESFLKDELIKRGYQPVYTPHIGKIELYQTSGHYPYYKDSQFPPIRMLERRRDGARRRPREGRRSTTTARRLLLADAGHPRARWPIAAPKCRRPAAPACQLLDARHGRARSGYVEEHGVSEEYLLKPMNCPHHIQIYAAQPRSYRDLPVRLAEFGTVYRYEQSGELSGMTRVRGFTQDDAHLFCTAEQVRGEFRATMELTQFVLNSLGLTDYKLRLSKRDPDDPKYAGRPARPGSGPRTTSAPCSTRWPCPTRRPPARRRSTARRPTSSSATASAAQWQLGTVQLDYVLPERFGLEYIGADNHAASPGDDPPRPVRQHGAVHGHPDRALRRRLPALARPRAGPRPADLATSSPTTPTRSSPSSRPPASARRSTTGPRRSAPRSATPSSRRSPPCSSSAARRPSPRPSPTATAIDGDRGSMRPERGRRPAQGRVRRPHHPRQVAAPRRRPATRTAVSSTAD